MRPSNRYLWNLPLPTVLTAGTIIFLQASAHPGVFFSKTDYCGIIMESWSPVSMRRRFLHAEFALYFKMNFMACAIVIILAVDLQIQAVVCNDE